MDIFKYIEYTRCKEEEKFKLKFIEKIKNWENFLEYSINFNGYSGLSIDRYYSFHTYLTCRDNHFWLRGVIDCNGLKNLKVTFNKTYIEREEMLENKNGFLLI
jgi:hypothetical protein